MEESYEVQYHKLERDHWWFKARRDIIKHLVKEFPKDAEILDVGCSGGALIEELTKENYFNITGIDISKKAIELSKNRGIKNCYVMDGENIKFNKKFDIIIASDVLEHIKNDKAAVRSWRSALKRNGEIICFVPALKSLWSQHDIANQHYRRYNEKMLISLFKKEKMKIKRLSFWNFSLIFPVYLIRMIQNIFLKNKSNKHQLSETNKIINNQLYTLLSIENRLLRYFNFPIGISLFLVAKNIN